MPAINPGQIFDRNLAMDAVRVTEAAALSAARYMGMGDKNLVDQAAVDAMRQALAVISMDGIVVIGEGEKDEAPMLFNGERVGDGSRPAVDVAVDPVDGTTLLSKGLSGAISAIALSRRGTMHVPPAVMYMNKIAVGREGRDVIDIDAPVAVNLRSVARAKGCQVSDLTVVVLDRPRHEHLLADIRKAGGRVRPISVGDAGGGIHAAMPSSDIDLLMGIGGTPEAVLTAAAIRCIGGAIQCKPWPRNDDEMIKAQKAGLDLNQVFHTEDLVGGDDVYFAATGVSTGDLLKGVRFQGGSGQTHSLVMRSRSGTIRWIDTQHDFTRLPKLPEEPRIRHM